VNLLSIAILSLRPIPCIPRAIARSCSRRHLCNDEPYSIRRHPWRYKQPIGTDGSDILESPQNKGLCWHSMAICALAGKPSNSIGQPKGGSIMPYADMFRVASLVVQSLISLSLVTTNALISSQDLFSKPQESTPRI
jgi:hypothetical protein